MTYKVYTLFNSGLINIKNPEINYFYAFVLILAVEITVTKGMFLINVKDVK